MKGKRLAKAFVDFLKDTGLWDEEICYADVLDFLACQGIDGAADDYIEEVTPKLAGPDAGDLN